MKYHNWKEKAKAQPFRFVEKEENEKKSIDFNMESKGLCHEGV